MLFERVYDEDLAQASYFVGCQATSSAIVVDPSRDIQAYLDLAAKNGMTIESVTETHIHADFLSGARELAEATGATLYLSDEGDENWKYGFGDVKLHDGDEIKVGNLVLKAVHTPGHTPEHLSFLLTDGATTDEPGFFLTGDFVFVGDLGRPDLLEEAAGIKDTREVGAKQMFESLRKVFMQLPDYIQVWPGHGAGSACGRALGAVPSSTVGYEKLFSWWAQYVAEGDEEGFVKALTEGQPDAPKYFGRMKRQNKSGPAVLGKLGALKRYEATELQQKLDAGEVVFIDTRPMGSYIEDAVEGSVHVPWGNNFATWGSWVYDPEADERPIVVYAADEEQADAARRRLIRVGIDTVAGYVDTLEGLRRSPVEMVSPQELAKMDDVFVLDARTKSEHEGGHIPNAEQIHGGRVLWNLDQIPQDKTIVAHCQGGPRGAVAASVLRSRGFKDVRELEGSYAGWKQAQQESVRA